MKLYELKPGDKFGFLASRHGREFVVVAASQYAVGYKETSTGETKTTTKERKTFREEVYLLSDDVELRLTRSQAETLKMYIQEYEFPEIKEILTQLKNKGI